MSFFIHLGIGLLFGIGLVVSGMSDPTRVLNFLDLALLRVGQWDPSLAFVLAGAVGVSTIGYKLVLSRAQPLFADDFHLPMSRVIDAPLVLGAAIFGVGWGISGICPGPALVLLGSGNPATSPAAAIFVVAMLAGMIAARQASGPIAGALSRKPSAATA
jgi:hypothetical protein